MLKVYKTTIEICVPLSLFSFSFAYGFYLMQFNFLMSWMLGIGSSLIVVIITTYIQFKNQKQKVVEEIEKKVKAILSKMFDLLLCGFSKDPDNDLIEIIQDINTVNALSQMDLVLSWRRKINPFEKIAQLTYRMKNLYYETHGNAERLKVLVCKKYYISLAKSAKQLCAYDFEKESYQYAIDKLKIIESKHSIKLYSDFDEYINNTYDFEIPKYVKEAMKDFNDPDFFLKYYLEKHKKENRQDKYEE